MSDEAVLRSKKSYANVRPLSLGSAAGVPQAHGGGLVRCACANCSVIDIVDSTARWSSIVDDAIKLACAGSPCPLTRVSRFRHLYRILVLDERRRTRAPCARPARSRLDTLYR